MSAINISLSSSQANYIDQLIKKYDFANRSELIRFIIRLIIYQPELIKTVAVFPFVFPKEKSAKKVISAFTQTNHYSKEFLKDLKEGLKNSDYFTN